MRIMHHPILGKIEHGKKITIKVDDKIIEAFKGESIATALMANGISVFRRTVERNEPRGLFCAIGRCTDCVMIVNGQPNVRTCITFVEDGMVIKTQKGRGKMK